MLRLHLAASLFLATASQISAEPSVESSRHVVDLELLGFATPTGSQGLSYTYLPGKGGLNVGFGRGATGQQFTANYAHRVLTESQLIFMRLGLTYSGGTTATGRSYSGEPRTVSYTLGDMLWANVFLNIDYFRYKTFRMGGEVGLTTVLATDLTKKTHGSMPFCDMLCSNLEYEPGDTILGMNFLVVGFAF